MFHMGVVTIEYTILQYNICLGRCDRDWTIIVCVTTVGQYTNIAGRVREWIRSIFFLPLQCSLHSIYLRPRIKRLYNIVYYKIKIIRFPLELRSTVAQYTDHGTYSAPDS